MKKTVMIIGCGDVGTRLGILLQDQYSIVGVRRNVAHVPSTFHTVSVDITDLAAVKTQLSDSSEFDVDYLVVATAPDAGSEAMYKAVYKQGLQNVLSVIAPKQRLFLVSSTSVYAQRNGDWVDETSETAPKNYRGQTQLVAETIALSQAFPATVARLSGIYGPNRKRLISQVKDGVASPREPVAYGNRVHAHDAARALAHLIKLDDEKVALDSHYLVTDHEPSMLADVKQWIADQLGLVDHWQTESISRVGSKRCSNQRLLNTGFEFKYKNYREGYSDILAQDSY